MQGSYVFNLQSLRRDHAGRNAFLRNGQRFSNREPMF